MRVKKQWITRTEGSLAAAIAYSILKVFEDYSEEPDPWSTYTDLDLEDLSHANWSTVGSVEARLWGSTISVDEIVEVSDAGVRVRVVSEPRVGGRPLAELYMMLPGRVAMLDSSFIKRLAWETAKSGIEYMIIYLSSGSVAVLEGDLYNVNIPFVDSVGQIHTHPSGACGLSRADIDTGLAGLVEGVLFEAAATIDCLFYMARIGLVSEDDYIKVKTLNSEVLEPMTMSSVVFGRMEY